jgi:pyruvate/2-oxoglutarate dehydrogenase complex dihydrolipoamide dehydrogenase (E3) component
VLGTGTHPAVPPIDGLTDTPFWTNRAAVNTPDLPASLIVLGGGAVGVELAQAYARFGVTVTVVEASDRLLPAEEPEASGLLAGTLANEGITLHLGARATKVVHDDAGSTVTLTGGVEVHAERLLVATGRRPNLDRGTLVRRGTDVDAEVPPVDERMRVTDGVCAVGDVTGHGAFTHVATYQADLVVADILGEPGPDADYRALPRVTFTDPEIGAVGLTEAEARERGIRVATGSAHVPSTARGWLHKARAHRHPGRRHPPGGAHTRASAPGLPAEPVPVHRRDLHPGQLTGLGDGPNTCMDMQFVVHEVG